jgi:hypothetical protein
LGLGRSASVLPGQQATKVNVTRGLLTVTVALEGRSWRRAMTHE